MSLVAKTLSAPAAALMLCAVLSAAAPARADESLGQFRDWYAIAYVEDGKKICYMVSQPTKSEGDYAKRGSTYIQVTRRAGEKGPDVVSVVAGYSYRQGSEVEVVIDGAGHKLFTSGEAAWAYDGDADKALVTAMAKGTRMVVKGVSSRDTETTDTYSLLGFTAAHREISKACGK